MKTLPTLLVSAITLGSLFLPAIAKQTLPVTVRCTEAGVATATVRVTANAPAKSFTVTVAGTGSVSMDKVVRQSQTVSQFQEITVPVTFTSGPKAGGLVVEVRADFGHGVQSQIRTFGLVDSPQQASDAVRARTDGTAVPSPDFVIVPARTQTKER